MDLLPGSIYLFRTVTMIYAGEFVSEEDDHFVLRKAAWIAETEQWSTSVATGKFREVEPYPVDELVRVYKSGMLDVVKLPRLVL